MTPNPTPTLMDRATDIVCAGAAGRQYQQQQAHQHLVEVANIETERRQRIVAEMAEQVRLQSDRIVALEGEIARLRAERRSPC